MPCLCIALSDLFQSLSDLLVLDYRDQCVDCVLQAPRYALALEKRLHSLLEHVRPREPDEVSHAGPGHTGHGAKGRVSGGSSIACASTAAARECIAVMGVVFTSTVSAARSARQWARSTNTVPTSQRSVCSMLSRVS